MVGQLDHKILVSLSLFDTFEEHGMTVVKITVIQLATAEHEVELRELINNRAAARNDRANKKM